MKTRNQTLSIEGINVQLQRKRVRHLRLAVSPPDGRVRVSVPVYLPDEVVWMFLHDKLDWIRAKQTRFAGYIESVRMQFVTGECHYYLGQPYRLDIIEQHGRQSVVIQDGNLIMLVRPGSGADQRARILDAWYRRELKDLIPTLLDKWEVQVGRPVADWRVKKMKTRWGSCNISRRRIWLNLELAKRPLVAIEYVLLHELVHLRERNHNKQFYAYMDRFMPDWRLQRKSLAVDTMLASGEDGLADN